MEPRPEYHEFKRAFTAERGRPPTPYEAWRAALTTQAPAEPASTISRELAEKMKADYKTLTDAKVKKWIRLDAGRAEDEKAIAISGYALLCQILDSMIAAPAPVEPAREPWIPYLSDRADGVQGHYAICRWNPKGYREAWSLYRETWGSASEEVLTLEQAQRLLISCRFDRMPEFSRTKDAHPAGAQGSEAPNPNPDAYPTSTETKAPGAAGEDAGSGSGQ